MKTISTIGQIAITVDDVPRAVRFYRDALGLPFLFEAPPQLAFFDCGGIRLMLAAPESPDAARANSVLYFKVDDIHATRRALIQRGVAFIDEPHLIAKMPDHELWMTFFKDVDGNTHALMSEVRQ